MDWRIWRAAFSSRSKAGKGRASRRRSAGWRNKLRDKRYPVVVTREPGGSPGAEAIRHVILSGAAEPFGPEMEALLFAAARSDHIEQLIRPALRRGKIVLCDRFVDSWRVYQGAAGNIDAALLDEIERVSVNGVMPDMTLIFDIDPEEGLAPRIGAPRRGPGRPLREGDARRPQAPPRRPFWTSRGRSRSAASSIDASADAEAVENAVTAAVFAALEARSHADQEAVQGA